MGEVALTDESHDVWFLELMPLKILHDRGAFDDRGLIQALNNREIAAIALDAGAPSRSYRGRQLFWPELQDAIRRNYTMVRTTGLYLPLPKPSP